MEEPIKLNAVQTKKFVKIRLQRAFGAQEFTLSTKEGTLILSWKGGPTVKEVEEVCSDFERSYMGYRSTKTFTEAGKVYLSGFYSVHCHRTLTTNLLKRYATLVCRQYQQKLPDIYQTTTGASLNTPDISVEVEGYSRNLGTYIKEFAQHISEAQLVELEKQADDLYAPLPAFTNEELEQKERQRQESLKVYAKSLELKRQRFVYCLTAYQMLGCEEDVKASELAIEHNAAEVKRVYNAFQDPVICSFCYMVAERDICQAVGTSFVCPQCVLVESASLTSCDIALPDGPVEFLPEGQYGSIPASLLPSQEEEPYKFLRTWDNIYIGKNGDPLPILTRDLLHDIRFGKWWLGFAHKPDEAIRKAMRQAGWQWGPGKREWYHPNKFVVIPSFVIDAYGGYIDGGFCAYRQTRGERLRSYADVVERKADQRQEMSNDLVQHYMSTGTLIVGPRRTRALQKKKMRAERYAQEARNLDTYVHELRQRANDSERHQARVTTTSLLLSVIERLQAESRKLKKDFLEGIIYLSEYIHDPERYRSMATILDGYEEITRRMEVIAEEVEWLEAVIEQRRQNAAYKKVEHQPQDVPQAPQRTYAVEEVVEVSVGSDNRLDLHPTPPELGDMLLNHPELYPIPPYAKRIIEGHGGTAALLKRIQKYQKEHNIPAELHTCELNYQLNEQLREAGYEVKAARFEEWYPEYKYDAVIINPPFSSWLAQVEHALSLLAEGGTLLAILPRSFFGENPKIKKFRELVETDGAYVEVEGGYFKESGTDIPVVLVSVSK